MSSAIPPILTEKMGGLERLVSRLQVVDSDQAFVLLKYGFSIPKLSYILRASPAYQHVADLEVFDSILRGALSAVTNVEMDNHVWRQASLTVGLGERGGGGGLAMSHSRVSRFAAFGEGSGAGHSF